MPTYAQSVSFNNCPTVLLRWPDFKTIIQAKNLQIQYIQDSIIYNIFAYDGSVVYNCILAYDSNNYPFSSLSPDYSQSQNDTDVSDFTTNFLSSANKRISGTDTFGNPIYCPINYAISFGLFPNVNSGTINGYVPTSATTTVALRATAYIQPGTAAQRSLKSSSTNDASAGTGARTVQITYYDGYMTGPYTEIVTLNGTTTVATVNSNIQFIEKMEVLTVGSGGANAGTISLFVNNAGSGGTIGTIAASDNSTFWAHHYVPANKICYLLGVRAGGTATNGSVNVQITGSPLISNLAFKNISGSIRYGSANQVVSIYEWELPIQIPGPNMIIMNAKPDATTASTTLGSFDFFEY